jgi:hypothetical protein
MKKKEKEVIKLKVEKENIKVYFKYHYTIIPGLLLNKNIFFMDLNLIYLLIFI